MSEQGRTPSRSERADGLPGRPADARIRDLRELARDVPPRRDLWPDIRAQIEPTAASGIELGGGAGATGQAGARRLAIGLAAAIALVAVGVWVGRSSVPDTASTRPRVGAPDTAVQPVAYVADPRYREQRAALLAQVDAQIAALPLASQAKVRASLVTIQKAVADLEAELGREPSSALLQELLVNARQDEMRVLTTIAEAGAAGREI